MKGMEKIKEWAKKIAIAIVAVILFLFFCVGRIEVNGTNFQEVQMRANEGSKYVAQRYMPNAEPNYEEDGIVRYIETFEDKEKADELFLKLVEMVNNLHSGEKINRYGNHAERYLLCYGREQSILVSQREYKRRGSTMFYAVSMQYIETESYDWDNLTSRIK